MYQKYTYIMDVNLNSVYIKNFSTGNLITFLYSTDDPMNMTVIFRNYSTYILCLLMCSIWVYWHSILKLRSYLILQVTSVNEANAVFYWIAQIVLLAIILITFAHSKMGFETMFPVWRFPMSKSETKCLKLRQTHAYH